MKTLAELKREAKAGGLYLEIVERFGGNDEEHIPGRMRGVRKVLGANTVALKLLNNDGKESELRIESASLMEYDGQTLSVYNSGLRDLNSDELEELNKAKEERLRYEKDYPFNDSFWHMKRFYQNCRFPYLDGFEMKQGKLLCHTKDGDKIRDRSVKGERILVYKVTRD